MNKKTRNQQIEEAIVEAEDLYKFVQSLKTPEDEAARIVAGFYKQAEKILNKTQIPGYTLVDIKDCVDRLMTIYSINLVNR